MHTSHAQTSSRLWLVLWLPISILTGMAGWQLGALTAPVHHDAFTLPSSTSKATESGRPAPTLQRPSTRPPPQPSAPPSSSVPSGLPPQPSLQAAAPAIPSPPPGPQAQQLFARHRSQQATPEESLNPYLPGHSISSNGQRVFIETTRVIPESGQNELGAALVPDPESSPSAAFSANSRSLYARIGRGFTPEELAFRAKWGWAAHNAALRAAFEASDGAP